MKVSAIIPAYNSAEWIEEAIISIKRQTRPVHELIVVDDGSTDGTSAIARHHGAYVVTLAVNSGEGAARNAGLQRATGDLTAWLDADDFWAPHHVQVLTTLLERHPQASAACGGIQQFGLQTFRYGGVAPTERPGNLFWRAASDWIHPLTGTLIWRKALIEIDGFATEPRTSVDYDMWLRFTRERLVIGTRDVTSFWRWHSAQQSQNPAKQVVAMYVFQRRYLDCKLSQSSSDDAGRFSQIMRDRWRADFEEGIRRDDYCFCRAIFEVRNLIPDLPLEVAAECELKLQSLSSQGVP